jgi:hypothetical protein
MSPWGQKIDELARPQFERPVTVAGELHPGIRFERADKGPNSAATSGVLNRALALFGERGVVDLIGVSGYYTAVSMTLNVAQVISPEGAPLPLK